MSEDDSGIHTRPRVQGGNSKYELCETHAISHIAGIQQSWTGRQEYGSILARNISLNPDMRCKLAFDWALDKHDCIRIHT